MECGYDTDCNGGNVGSVMGAMLGVKGINEKWFRPLGDEIISSSSVPYLNLDTISNTALKFALMGARLNGERHDEYLEDFQKILARRPELKESKGIRKADQQWRLHNIQRNIDSAISRKVQANSQYRERVAQKAAQIEQARRAKAAAKKATATPSRSRIRGRSRDDDYSR